MEHGPERETILTARLELVSLTPSFVAALVAGDLRAARAELGARISPWLASDSGHFVQLNLAEIAGRAAGFAGLGRLIVVGGESHGRPAIGSIGFHGPPDDRGRLEVGCRIHPAHRGQGYAAEALAALLDWATMRFGISRYLVAVPSRHEPWELVPVDISGGQEASPGEPIEGIAELIELERQRPGIGGRAPGDRAPPERGRLQPGQWQLDGKDRVQEETQDEERPRASGVAEGKADEP